MKKKSLHWIILAGGRSSRMGGEDKGLIIINGQPLIRIVYDRLNKQISPIYINANQNLDKYAKLAAVHSDEIGGFQGPLAGIQSSLLRSNSQWVGFTPCDSPNLPNDLVTKLTADLDPNVDVYVAHDGYSVQPVFSVWNKDVLPKLDSFLNAGDRKIKRLLSICNTRYVDFSHRPDTFINLNTPEELNHFENNNDIT